MAGSYADYPGNRMAADLDGSAGVYIDATGTTTNLSTSDLLKISDESSDYYQLIPTTVVVNDTNRLAIVFPEARSVLGYFLGMTISSAYVSGYPSYDIVLQYSTNTTNGQDGAWSTASSDAAATWGAHGSAVLKPDYRTVASLGLSNIKGIRIAMTASTSGLASSYSFGGGVRVAAFHLFGTPAAASDRLELFHPSLAQRVSPSAFDWGNVPQGSTADVTFRVKNWSATLTANSIVVAIDAPTDTSPSVAAQHYVSTDGINFTSTVNIGSLAPGAVSSVLYLRRVTPSNAVLGTWSGRLKATPGSWT